MIFVGAFLMVFFAEMGDKSQLLAMTLATRFSIKVVLAGVVVATVINNGLAVLLGYYLQTALDLELIQILASAAFIGFGVWRLFDKDDEESTEEEVVENKSFWGPLGTVAAVLFLAEIGDKTQLATIAYVINYGSPLQTFLGVITGMVLADLLGILAGNYISRVLHKKQLIRWISAVIFILFGIGGLLLM